MWIVSQIHWDTLLDCQFRVKQVFWKMLKLNNKDLINHLFIFLHVWDILFFNVIKIIFGRNNLDRRYWAEMRQLIMVTPPLHQTNQGLLDFRNQEGRRKRGPTSGAFTAYNSDLNLGCILKSSEKLWKIPLLGPHFKTSDLVGLYSGLRIRIYTKLQVILLCSHSWELWSYNLQLFQIF